MGWLRVPAMLLFMVTAVLSGRYLMSHEPNAPVDFWTRTKITALHTVNNEDQGSLMISYEVSFQYNTIPLCFQMSNSVQQHSHNEQFTDELRFTQSCYRQTIRHNNKSIHGLRINKIQVAHC